MMNENINLITFPLFMDTKISLYPIKQQEVLSYEKNIKQIEDENFFLQFESEFNKFKLSEIYFALKQITNDCLIDVDCDMNKTTFVSYFLIKIESQKLTQKCLLRINDWKSHIEFTFAVLLDETTNNTEYYDKNINNSSFKSVIKYITIQLSSLVIGWIKFFYYDKSFVIDPFEKKVNVIKLKYGYRNNEFY